TTDITYVGDNSDMTNNGRIIVHNTIFRQSRSIYGSGCITADARSTIHLANTDREFDPNLKFELNGPDASMYVHLHSVYKIFTVYGFGNGNKIALSCDFHAYQTFPEVEYSEETGIMRARSGSLYRDFLIGPGYDPSKFEVVKFDEPGFCATNKGAVRYNGPVPNDYVPLS
ncbi:Hyphally regulated cell wall protein, partial [Candida maltosa Xu316]